MYSTYRRHTALPYPLDCIAQEMKSEPIKRLTWWPSCVRANGRAFPSATALLDFFKQVILIKWASVFSLSNVSSYFSSSSFYLLLLFALLCPYSYQDELLFCLELVSRFYALIEIAHFSEHHWRWEYFHNSSGTKTNIHEIKS